jgi:diguanylate cyclase (GGDEF)-like protein
VSEPAFLDDDAGGLPAPVRLVPAEASRDALVESYRRLADVFHDILSEQSLDALLERIADTLAELVPYDTLTVFEADLALRVLRPVMVRDQYATEIMNMSPGFGQGITGWAVEHREPVLVQQAHLDPRVQIVPGTPPDEPEALIAVPLIARDTIKGALSVYRLGEGVTFSEDEFELAQRFADAAALALDNAQIRARLEHQATTDSLTGLYNHRTFHERLRSELRAASRSGRSVGVLMFDIDDFKRVNDVHGHGVGDEVLREIAEALRTTMRGGDVVCRLGGEEFAVIIPRCQSSTARRLAERLTDLVSSLDFGPAGAVTISVGIAQGPEHAMNPRELVACAEAAMMTAKARGKDRIVLFEDDEETERPRVRARDVRSLAHMKMLQSLSGKLSRLNDVREIGTVIANELRSLIDYHNCRVFVVEGEDVVPIAFRGEFAGNVPTAMEVLACRLGEGITGRVAQTVQSLLTGDAARCEFAERIPGTDVIEESLIAVPLTYGSKAIGVIVISKLGLDQFDEDDVRLLEVLAGHAAVALENARLYEAQRREAESATALLDFSRQLATAQGLDETLARVVELSATLLGSPRTSVWLQHPGTEELVAQAAFGAQPHDAPLTVKGLLALEGPTCRGGFAIAPLALADRAGCIVAAATDGQGCTERELRLLGGLAHQAKLAIANAGAFRRLEETFFSTVEALANALEASDEYTSSHARWITDMSIKVGERLGLEGPALKRLELGALFHDIGKIGIPGSILTKPGRLTAEERRIVEMHPELGERILAPIELLQDVCPIVRHCHERYDGEGYPDRKAGQEIPIESRIILVCDAFHAMTTDRPYRKRLSAAEACRRLEQGAGTQFDPVVVDACLELLRARVIPEPPK